MGRYEIRTSWTPRGRRWRVVLIGDNNEIVASSESLNSRAAADTNIAAQRRYAGTSRVDVIR